MKEYLKMADYVDGSVSVSLNHRGDAVIAYDYANPNMIIRNTMNAMEHAINSHDELVAEVERLRKATELASMTLDEVDRVLTERIKNGAYDLDDISAEVEGAIKRLSETE